MELFSLVLSFLGICLAVVSMLLTYVTFFAPHITAKIALGSPKKWSEVHGAKESTHLYRHSFFSGFSIEVDFSEPITDRFFEPWMNALHRPDPSASSYYVRLYFNGLPLNAEMFLSYDGSRNFVPLPKVETRENKHYYYFDDVQKKLAEIVGELHVESSFEAFYERILTSQYNPIILSWEVKQNAISIDTLERRIADFKSKSKLLRRD